MSYTRRYRETVSKVVSKTVNYNYPASERGGSGSVYVEMEAVIPVEVNIDVDTRPFDRSVRNCDQNIDMLTASVVATEAAEIASKVRNSRKVADTIIGGFFSYIRSEISQQISELTQNIDAQPMHLKEMSLSVLAKKNRMEGDYNRISSRYAKVFEDLNSELSNRVFELDRPAFIFKKVTDQQKMRTSENDMVNTVAIFGKESGDLQSRIGSSIAKKRALDTLNKAKYFLGEQKYLNRTIQQNMLNESVSCIIYAPVCFMETNSINDLSEKNIYGNEYLSCLTNISEKNMMAGKLSSGDYSWVSMQQENQENISLYFNSELNSKSSANDLHTVRVREMIQKISNIGAIKTINSK